MLKVSAQRMIRLPVVGRSARAEEGKCGSGVEEDQRSLRHFARE